MNTASRGRSGVPEIFARTRACRRILFSCFVSCCLYFLLVAVVVVAVVVVVVVVVVAVVVNVAVVSLER